jgi:predicted secreted protein
MGIFEGIVVYVCSWWLIFLPILSAGTRSQHEAGTVIPGTEHSAPERIGWRWKILVPTLGAAALTFLLWLALRMHWLDFMIPRV